MVLPLIHTHIHHGTQCIWLEHVNKSCEILLSCLYACVNNMHRTASKVCTHDLITTGHFLSFHIRVAVQKIYTQIAKALK